MFVCFTFFLTPMKQSLAFLFAVYLFVIQPLFAWLLRQETNLLILALINVVILLIILLIYKATGTSDEQSKKPTHNTSEIHEERETLFHPHHNTNSKGKKKQSIWKWIIGIAIAIVIYILLVGSSFGYRLIVASLLALIILFIICLISGQAGKYFGLNGSKVLLGLLLAGLIIFWFEYAFLTVDSSLQEYIIKNMQDSRLLPSPGDDDIPLGVLTGEGTVIATGEVQDDISALLDDALQNNNTGDDTTAPSVPTTATWTSLSMGLMVQKLITQYNIPLSDSKDVKFVYIRYDDPLYPYFRTAYAKTLLGSNTNPTKLALCDTMIAMKGILEKRPINNKNAVQGYRNYATTHDRLNGCTQGKVVKDNNL